MKIMVVCQYYSPDPFRLCEVNDGLLREGHEVTVLAGTPNYSSAKITREIREEEKKKKADRTESYSGTNSSTGKS